MYSPAVMWPMALGVLLQHHWWHNVFLTTSFSFCRADCDSLSFSLIIVYLWIFPTVVKGSSSIYTLWAEGNPVPCIFYKNQIRVCFHLALVSLSFSLDGKKAEPRTKTLSFFFEVGRLSSLSALDYFPNNSAVILCGFGENGNCSKWYI